VFACVCVLRVCLCVRACVLCVSCVCVVCAGPCVIHAVQTGKRHHVTMFRRDNLLQTQQESERAVCALESLHVADGRASDKLETLTTLEELQINS
jgi:hypothetical protein